MTREQTHIALELIAHVSLGHNQTEPYQFDQMPPDGRVFSVQRDTLRLYRDLNPNAKHAILRLLPALERFAKSEKSVLADVMDLMPLRSYWNEEIKSSHFRRCIDRAAYYQQMRATSEILRSRLKVEPSPLMEAAFWEAARQHGLDGDDPDSVPQMWGRCPKSPNAPAVGFWYFLCERERVLLNSYQEERRKNWKQTAPRVAFWKEHHKQGNTALDMPLNKALALYVPPKSTKAK